MASQNCTIQELLEMINSLKTKVNELETVSKKSGIEILWRGGHYMDNGTPLVLSNYNFSDYSSIVVSCCCENRDDYIGGWQNCCIYCPTAIYGSRSHTSLDTTGDDWAAAYLKDEHTIIPQASHGMWIRAVYGIR